MKTRFLTYLNAIGCLLLVALTIFQWLHQHSSDQQLTASKNANLEIRNHLQTEKNKTQMLEGDIKQLKSALEATQKAAEESTKNFAAKDNLVNDLQQKIASMDKSSPEWQQAIAQRDQRIKDLSATLTATRKRLDESIAELRSKGAK